MTLISFKGIVESNMRQKIFHCTDKFFSIGV